MNNIDSKIFTYFPPPMMFNLSHLRYPVVSVCVRTFPVIALFSLSSETNYTSLYVSNTRLIEKILTLLCSCEMGSRLGPAPETCLEIVVYCRERIFA